MDQKTNPWRCWERLTLPAVLNGPEHLLVRVALKNTSNGIYQSEFRWPALVRLGPNDFAGKYAQITLRFGDAIWSFEMTSQGNIVMILVRHVSGDARDVQIRLETFYQERTYGKVLSREEEVIAYGEARHWRIWSPTPTSHREGTSLTAPLERPFFAVIEPASDKAARIENRNEAERTAGTPRTPLTAVEKQLLDEINTARKDYYRKFAYVPDELWWAYAGIPYTIGWNMIYAAERHEPIEVCSRDWCVHDNYGGWVLFNWDTFMLVPAAADYDKELAHQILRPQLSLQTWEGLVPGIASPLGVSADRGMPPVAALSLWKTYLRTGDTDWVEEYYDPIRLYHEWWSRNRDGNNDGLLEWGSNRVPPPHPQWQAHTAWAARYETGMDNHPMWDGVKFNRHTNTQEQSDIGLNALFAADALCLSKMAALVGSKNDAAKYLDEAAAYTGRIEKHLWNSEIGLWLSRAWSGEWNYRASPICFYPMLLPGIEKDHVGRAIRNHLRNPARFGGKYAMPVSPRDDPAYPEQYYVRGRIWPPQMVLVHAGLRESGQEDAATELANAALETMRKEWLGKGHLHENYNAETSDAHDTAESDPVYSFGLMLPLLAWYHLRDVKIDGTEITAPIDSLEEQLDKNGDLKRVIQPLDSLPPLD